MSLYALLRNNEAPSEHDVEEAFDGNLCRWVYFCFFFTEILFELKTLPGCVDSICHFGVTWRRHDRLVAAMQYMPSHV